MDKAEDTQSSWKNDQDERVPCAKQQAPKQPKMEATRKATQV